MHGGLYFNTLEATASWLPIIPTSPLLATSLKPEDFSMNAGNDTQNVAAFIEKLQDPDHVVRIRAATVLGALGEKALAAVPALIELLQAERAHDRLTAALALGKIGPAAEESLPALCAAVDDEDEGVSDMAEWALKEIDVVEDQAEAA